MLNIKIKKVHPNAKIPKYAKPGDAGLDITCVDITEAPDFIEYNTGLQFEIPEGYVGLLFPRSSNTKKDLILGNSVGVLDSSFRGTVTFRYKRLYNMSKVYPDRYNLGDRIGQILIIPYPEINFIEVTQLSDTERGEGCYGHTGT